jgi:hypothetical protein
MSEKGWLGSFKVSSASGRAGMKRRAKRGEGKKGSAG